MKQRLITAAVFLCCMATSFAQFSGPGSGTESDPYLISNPIHLNQIRNFINQNVYFKLMNDIDLTEFLEEENPSEGWLPIGGVSSTYNSNSFKGVLDGNGKTIRGLWIKRPSSENVGFFYTMDNATIKDLTIEAANIEGSSGGIIAGSGVGYITITGCSVSGVVKGIQYLGGYVGQLNLKVDGNYYYDSDCTLSNNIAKVSVIGTSKCVGGFAGFVSAKPIMSDCTFYDSNVRGTEYVGGLFGKAEGRFTGYGVIVNLSHCGYIGEITGTSNVGGLIGYIKHDDKFDKDKSYIKNCFSISNIDATGDNIGGIVGYDYDYKPIDGYHGMTLIDNNYYCGSVKGANNVGGIVGYKDKSEITSCLAIGSVEGSSYVGGIIGHGENTKVLRNVAIDTQVTATTSQANRIGYSGGSMGIPGTADENKAYNKVIVTEQGVEKNIVDNNRNGAGVGAFTLKQEATYTAMGFNFNNVWEISDGEGYPYIIGSTQIWPADRKDVSSLTISPITGVIYNGSAQTPTVTVKDGSTILTNGIDYTVSYSNNINVGTATVTITGEGNYTGTKTASFIINAKNASNLTISSISSRVYTGSAQTPAVTVKDGTTTLTNGTDYTVSYSNNINVGTATVTITGKGNYTGTKTANFTIYGRSASDFTVSSIANVTYSGLAQTPTVTVKDGTTILISGTDYTVSYSNNINAGTATVTITGKGNYTGTKAATFTIQKASLIVTAKSYTINQGNPLPTFEANYSGFKNGENSSVLTTQPTFTCNATSASAPGTYNITVSGAAAQNYSMNYTNGTLTILAASPKVNFADANVKALCVANWDTNNDGALSEDEAAAVTSLGDVFTGNEYIVSFNELQYFTGLTSLDDSAFEGCSGLTTIVIPNGVTSIGHCAFYGTSLTSITIPNNVKNFGCSVFELCGNLSSVVLPYGITCISEGMFTRCIRLTSITIPNSVTSINNNAFAETGLTSINIPSTVTSIVDYAFWGCSALETITVEQGNMVYDSRNNCNAIIETATNALIAGCKNTVIPNTVTSIYSCAFLRCYGLTSIEIPNSVTTIGSNAFSDCTGLTSVTIPNSVTSIGGYAFKGCSGLTSVTIERETPINLTYQPFSNYANATLYVPKGSKDAYTAANYWKEFKEIVEIDDGSSDEEEEENPDTDISSMNNVIYLDKVEANPDSQIILSIKMKNSAAIRGFQFDIYLPEGVTVVKSAKGKIIGSLSEGRLPEDDEHSLTLSEQGDGAIRFLCGSLYDETFTGTDGEIATLTVKTAANMEDGNYPIILRNMKLTETDINNYYQTDYVKSTLTISSYTLGDINNDHQIDVSDYIGIANHILGSTPEGFNMKAADVNEDGNIDVSDYIGVANIILTGSVYGTANAPMMYFAKKNEILEGEPE